MIPVIPPVWLIFCHAVVMCAMFAIMYRRTVAVLVLEGVAMGMIGASSIASAWLTVQNTALAAIQLGETIKIIPILFGLGYATFFVPRLRGIYRMIATVVMASTFGLTVPLMFKTTYAAITGYTSLSRGAGDVLMIVLFVFGLLSWTFGQKFAEPLKYPRIVGFFLLYTYCGLQGPPTLYRMFDNTMFMIYEIATSPAIIVPVIAGILVAIDYTRRKGIILAKAAQPT